MQKHKCLSVVWMVSSKVFHATWAMGHGMSTNGWKEHGAVVVAAATKAQSTKYTKLKNME